MQKQYRLRRFLAYENQASHKVKQATLTYISKLMRDMASVLITSGLTLIIKNQTRLWKGEQIKGLSGLSICADNKLTQTRSIQP